MHQSMLEIRYGDEMWCDTFFDLSEPQTVCLVSPCALLLFLCCPKTQSVRTFSDVPKKTVDVLCYGPETPDAQEFADRLIVSCRLTAETVWTELSDDERQLLQNEFWRHKTNVMQISKALNMEMRQPERRPAR